MSKKTKTTKKTKKTIKITVQTHQRRFDEARLPPRTSKGRFTRRRQGDLFR